MKINDIEQLKTVSGYCCLGVLCDLYGIEHNVEWEVIPFIGTTFLESKDYLPEEVVIKTLVGQTMVGGETIIAKL